MPYDRICTACGRETPHELEPRFKETPTTANCWQVMKCSRCGNETPEEVRNIYVEFLGGGFHDGDQAPVPDAQGVDIRFYYIATRGGEIGRRIIRGGGEQGHKYELAERVFENGELLLRFKYLGVHE